MARTVYEIPLSPEAQVFTIALAGTAYVLSVRWNRAALCWSLDVATAARAPLVSGVPLVTGLDLLAQYRHLGIAGSLVVQTDHAPDDVPTALNLGTLGRLYFVAEGA